MRGARISLSSTTFISSPGQFQSQLIECDKNSCDMVNVERQNTREVRISL